MAQKINLFERFSNWATKATGSAPAFIIAVIIIIVWGITGPIFKFSEVWQLIINTGTTIVTFLMVFLIQKSQNKDSKAIHLKLNELIAADKYASNRMVSIEDLSEKELDLLHQYYLRLTELAKKITIFINPTLLTQRTKTMYVKQILVEKAFQKSKMKIEIHKVNEQNELEKVFAIRKEVFVVEQDCPPELEWEHEDESVHFLAKVDEKPAGACRWRKTEKGYKLERFAVLKKNRGFGVGKALVKAVLADLPKNAAYIYLHAQIQAVSLYEKFNFEKLGDKFEEAGISHYKMVLRK